MIYAAAILTVCFLGFIAVLLTAPEGHETPGVGFHTGPLDGCPECRTLERGLDAGEGQHDAGPFVADDFSPFHASEVAHD